MDVRIHHVWKNEDAFSILFIKSHNANNPIDVCSFRRETESNDCTPKHNPHVNDYKNGKRFYNKELFILCEEPIHVCLHCSWVIKSHKVKRKQRHNNDNDDIDIDSDNGKYETNPLILFP